MFCSIYKWRVSKALDSGIPYSGGVVHHLEHCSSCREFVAFSEKLQKRTAASKPDFSKGYPSNLPHRIMANLDKPPASKPKWGLHHYLVPVTTSAILILAVSTSVYFLTSPRNTPLVSLDELLPLNQAQASLGKTLNGLDSPLEAEYQSLKNAVEATTEYLISRFEIKLGQEQE